MKAVRLSISGRVQGVGFRWWTVRTARRLGVCGWVCNEADGSVCVHAEGSGGAIDTLIAACRQGPEPARVDAVVARATAVEGFASFEQRP